MDYSEYWAKNTAEMYLKVATIKKLLELHEVDTDYIRVGSENDGGYILANDIKPSDHVISFGVDNNVDFENQMSNFGCSVDMYDYSITKAPVGTNNGIKFFNKKIVGEFGPSGLSSEEATLSECIPDTDNDMILKVDIEGAEWDVLMTSNKLSRFRQIVFEAHWMHKIENTIFYNDVVKTLANLRNTHIPVWVHANNNVPLMIMGNSPIPTVFEVLFLRKDSYTYKTPTISKIQTLTNKNDINFPEIGLSFP